MKKKKLFKWKGDKFMIRKSIVKGKGTKGWTRFGSITCMGFPFDEPASTKSEQSCKNERTRRKGMNYGAIKPEHYKLKIKNTEFDFFDVGNAMGLSLEQFTALRYMRKKGDKKKQREDTDKAIECLKRHKQNNLM